MAKDLTFAKKGKRLYFNKLNGAEGGIRTRTPVRHYPLKIACLPDSTTSARDLGQAIFPGSRQQVPRFPSVLPWAPGAKIRLP